MPLPLAALRDAVPLDTFAAMLAAKNATDEMAACRSLEATSKVSSTLERLHKVASQLWSEMGSTDLAYWPWYDRYFAGNYVLGRLSDTLESMVSVLDDHVRQHDVTKLSTTRAREADSIPTPLSANAHSASQSESFVSEGLAELGRRIRAIGEMVASQRECKQTLEELKILYRLASLVEVSWAVAEYEGVVESEGWQDFDDEGDSF